LNTAVVGPVLVASMTVLPDAMTLRSTPSMKYEPPMPPMPSRVVGNVAPVIAEAVFFHMTRPLAAAR
jgi:hypothetical protein